MAHKIKYNASATSAKFHASKKVVRGLRGPVGNGKTVACVNELHKLAVEQYPNSDGVRKTRWAIIRNTYPELRTTTLNTFKQWIPEQLCPIVLSPLITGLLRYDLPDGTRVEAEFIFLALDKSDDVKKLLSLEVTGIFCNEARELPYAVIKGARERIGRYPAVIDGYMDVRDQNGNLIYDAPKARDNDGNPIVDEDGEFVYTPCKRKALIMDTNPPDDDHWWYQLAEEGCLRTNKSEQARKDVSNIFEFFAAPAPLFKKNNKYIRNPNAENVRNLPGGYKYYLDMIAGNTEDHINVMVLGNYGMIRDGRPVYTNYNDRVHCPDEPLRIIEDLPIGLGWDFGLTPCVAFGQLTEEGQMRVFAELVSEDMNVREFAENVVKPFMKKNFDGMDIAFSHGDPAGNNRGEGEGKSSIGILNDQYIYDEDGKRVQEPLKLGFITEKALTNDPTKRIDAVASVMGRLVKGMPAYQLSKNCRVLRKAKNGGYQYKKIRVTGTEDKFQQKPDKGKYSHISDAEQYLILGFLGTLTDVDEDSDNYGDYEVEAGAMGY